MVTEDALTILSGRRDSEHRVAAAGELDIASAERLQSALLEVEATDAMTIVLDLSGLTFIDSTGLRTVIDANARCGGPDGRLRVIAGAPAVERLLDLVGLRERLPLITP